MRAASPSKNADLVIIMVVNKFFLRLKVRGLRLKVRGFRLKVLQEWVT